MTEFIFPLCAEHSPPVSFTTRDLTIDGLTMSYGTIRREKIAEIVDEAISKLESILELEFHENLG
jgi:hypothetical protein